MKHDVQKIVDEILEGSDEWSEKLPELMKDPEFREKYISLMVDESLLSSAVAVEAGRRNLDNKPKKKPIAFIGILAVAAALTLAFILLNRPKNYTVEVLSSSGSFTKGDHLNEGHRFAISEKENVTLEFKDKSKLNLFGPFKGNLMGNGIEVQEGFLTADIKNQGNKKFEIKTPGSGITVIGTAFNVSVLDGSTQLEVQEGTVKINKQSKSLEVTENEFVLASESVPFEVYKLDRQSIPYDVWKVREAHLKNSPGPVSKQFIEPVADAFIGSGALRHKNNGKSEILVVQIAESHVLSFIRFELGKIPSNVSSAKLRLYAESVSKETELMSLGFISDDLWQEERIKFNNGPMAKAKEILTWQPVEGHFAELDVTSVVKKELTGDKQLSLSIKSLKKAKGTKVAFPSKEHTNENLRPVLIISFK